LSALRILNASSPPLLIDKDLQAELRLEGIVQFPFLSRDALETLNSLYKSLHPVFPTGPIETFYVSSHSSDKDYKTKITLAIKETINPFCALHFTDYRILTSALLIKKPSLKSELGLHQDWSVVDENKFSSYGLWIPLVDVTSQNGAISVLKRSHRIGPTYRHTTLPSIYTEIQSIAEKHFTLFEVKAGHALLFNQALVHKSSANCSNNVRASIVSTIIPQNAKHQIYVRDNNIINAWLVEDDFVQTFDSFFEDSSKPPIKAQKVGTITDYDFTPISPNKFEQLYSSLF